MKILGIESTCDETACAIVQDGEKILSNVISSQIDLHAPFGGVVPELACREHTDSLLPVLQKALEVADLPIEKIDGIAVSYGPGLIGALQVGLNCAKTLSLALKIPFVGVNHIEAHLYAAMMGQDVSFPAMGVVLSGGHTSLILIDALGSYSLISETVDDAIGEAFDKAAKMLSLPYPGGPWIEKMALNGKERAFSFKAGQVKAKPLHFSFSGLKTALLYTSKAHDLSDDQVKADLCHAFQEASFNDVIQKISLALKTYPVSTLVFGGGVTQNQILRKKAAVSFPSLNLLWPHISLTNDNAAMIAGLGFHLLKKKPKGDPFNLKAETRIQFYTADR